MIGKIFWMARSSSVDCEMKKDEYLRILVLALCQLRQLRCRSHTKLERDASRLGRFSGRSVSIGHYKMAGKRWQGIRELIQFPSFLSSQSYNRIFPISRMSITWGIQPISSHTELSYWCLSIRSNFHPQFPMKHLHLHPARCPVAGAAQAMPSKMTTAPASVASWHAAPPPSPVLKPRSPMRSWTKLVGRGLDIWRW